MTNIIQFRSAKRKPKGHPTKDEILDGHFDDVLAKYKTPVPMIGIAVLAGIAVLGTGLPWLMAYMMKGLIHGF